MDPPTSTPFLGCDLIAVFLVLKNIFHRKVLLWSRLSNRSQMKSLRSFGEFQISGSISSIPREIVFCVAIPMGNPRKIPMFDLGVEGKDWSNMATNLQMI